MQPGERRDSRPRLVVVGSVNMDVVVRTPRLPRPGETITGHEILESPGGKGANQAVAAARAGAEVAFVGRIGDDRHGESLHSCLRADGIDTSRLLTTAQVASGVAVVCVADDGENAITVIPGANGLVSPGDIDEASSLFAETDALLVQLESPLATIERAVRVAREHDVRVILDPAPAPARLPDALFHVDVLCPNETEATALTGEAVDDVAGAERAARALVERGARAAIVTLGSRGALLLDAGGRPSLLPPFRVEAIDSTAAGDAFAGALGVALARGSATYDAARFASAAGALAASRLGAQPAMPSLGEIVALLDTQSHGGI